MKVNPLVIKDCRNEYGILSSIIMRACLKTTNTIEIRDKIFNLRLRYVFINQY